MGKRRLRPARRGRRSELSAVCHLPQWAREILNGVRALPAGERREAPEHLQTIKNLLIKDAQLGRVPEEERRWNCVVNCHFNPQKEEEVAA